MCEWRQKVGLLLGIIGFISKVMSVRVLGREVLHKVRAKTDRSRRMSQYTERMRSLVAEVPLCHRTAATSLLLIRGTGQTVRLLVYRIAALLSSLA